MWQGYGVDPKEGPCDLILDHIRNVVCAGDEALYEYILNWIAAKLQQPGRVMGTMPLFISGQGAGKGVIFDNLLMRIFGQHGIVIDDSDKLLGKFNKHLIDACYVFADECFFVGDRKAAQKMKRRITGNTIVIEPKGIDSVTAQSYLGIVAVTNETHAVNIDADDRRVVAGRCSDERRGDFAYFERLMAHIEGDGAAHFLDKMLKRDVSGWHPERDRPLTDETIAQREMSLHGVQRWWQEAVDSGEFPVSAFNCQVQVETPEGEMAFQSMSHNGTSWADRPIRVSKKMLRDSYDEWARKNAGERYSDTKSLAFWQRLREVAVFEKDGGSNADRKVLFAELPK